MKSNNSNFNKHRQLLNQFQQKVQAQANPTPIGGRVAVGKSAGIGRRILAFFLFIAVILAIYVGIRWNGRPHKLSDAQKGAILDQALIVAASVNVASWRCSECMRIASAWAKIDPQKALSVAESITDDGVKSDALCDVASIWAKSDPQKSNLVFQQALSVAESIKDDQEKSRALALGAVASAWAETDPQKATLLFMEALSTAQSISGSDRDRDVSDLVGHIVKATMKSCPAKHLYFGDASEFPWCVLTGNQGGRQIPVDLQVLIAEYHTPLQHPALVALCTANRLDATRQQALQMLARGDLDTAGSLIEAFVNAN